MYVHRDEWHLFHWVGAHAEKKGMIQLPDEPIKAFPAGE